MGGGFRFWAATVAVLAVFAAACFGDDRPAVEVARVAQARVTQTVSAPARVEAAARHDVVATVPGVVAAIERPDGARVRRGQTVVRLRSSDVESALQRARAARRDAQARAGAAPVSGAAAPGVVTAPPSGGVEVPLPGAAAVRAAKQTVADLDAEVRPQLRRARRDLRDIDGPDNRDAAARALDAIEAAYEAVRTALLASGRAAAERQDALVTSLSAALNDALAQAAAAQRAQAQALARAVQAQADTLAAAGQAQSQAASAAARAQAEAAVAAARARQRELMLTAPIRGVVQFAPARTDGDPALPGALDEQATGLPDALGALGALGGRRSTVRVGVPVSVGQPVFTVYDLSDLYVEAQVDEVDVPQVRRGQRAEVLVDAFPDATFEGVVESVSLDAAVSPAGGVAYPVRVRLFDAPRGRRPRVGMTASVEVVTRTVDAALAVPSRAIVRRDDRTAVYVVRDGRAVVVPVELQALGEELAAVDGDLSEDDRVVVSGYEDLADGEAVRTE